MMMMMKIKLVLFDQNINLKIEKNKLFVILLTNKILFVFDKVNIL